MSDYALSTNLYTFAQAEQGFFGWPNDTGEAETIKKLAPGDLIIPKFAQTPAWAGSDGDADVQRAYCDAIGVDYDNVLQKYDQVVAGGQRAVPFLLRVIESLDDDERPSGAPWTRVAVEMDALTHPFSSGEFLRLRAIPVTVAVQFKGAVAPGRHLQELDDGTIKAVQQVAGNEDRGDALRRYTLVEAQTADEALQQLEAADRARHKGDRVFIAAPGGLPGVHEVAADELLEPIGAPIPRTPDELEEIFEQAALRAKSSDRFTPSRAIAAAKEIKDLLAGPGKLVLIDDFNRFHDRYDLLANKINQALEINARPYEPSAGPQPEPPIEEEETDSEFDELAALQGLDVEAVREELPDYMVLTDSVLREAVTALRAGKHLLLSGPPGTGKSTIAEAICRAVVGNQYDVATGTADWTTFDTIGGYMPSEKADEGLTFEPGLVLRALQRGRWLVIDELNRADIDKAFGPLFTLLAGTGDDQPNRRVVLPFHREGKNIEIRWAEKRAGAKGDYVLTPGWRLIGTLNVSDKATLFRLSFAFLRRFAVVEVPLPPRNGYRDFFRDACGEIAGADRDKIVQAAMELAFAKRQLGPAILNDVAGFLRRGLAPTSAGPATYPDAVDAFVTAIRLFAVPQYEGAESSETDTVLKVLQGVWPERPGEFWQLLEEALDGVALD
jgi:MoxR-like ATPase